MQSKALRLLIFGAVLVGIWQLIVAAQIWPPYLVPSPGRVLRSLWTNVENGMVVGALGISLRRLVIGYTIALGVGLTIGVMTGTLSWADDTLGRLVLGLQSLPSITWLPLAVLWFGLGEWAIIFVVLMGSVLAIAISARDGVHRIPPLLKRAAQTFGASRWQMYRFVILPGMMPSMVQGLRLGWSFAWRSLMAGELIFVTLGLGHLLNLGRDLNDMSLVVAMMIVIVAVGLTFDQLLFGRIEAWVKERWDLRSA